MRRKNRSFDPGWGEKETKESPYTSRRVDEASAKPGQRRLAYFSSSPLLLRRLRARFRAKRAAIFRRIFPLTPDTRILDLGGSSGTHISAVLAGTDVDPSNCVIADVNRSALDKAEAKFGFRTVALSPRDSVLPFAAASFDIVFCSSVLEHVTFPGPEYWEVTDGRVFRDCAHVQQAKFAAEIRRIGSGYFVQVPYRHFPVETHTYLPFFQYLRRRYQVAMMKHKRFRWLRQVPPDFYLPTRAEFQAYFPEATIRFERVAGLVKSLIATKSSAGGGNST
ncbi:MAG TPA: class I SAM-dependent methyltransferase [Rhizomicrobium sp.]|nr:class I SAM-dependent methyltransferase [Rhizomicrobium sp.]